MELPKGRVSPNFQRSEFDCKDGTPAPREYDSHLARLAAVLELGRARLGGRPMIIVSGYRTPTYNAGFRNGVLNPAKAGAKNSYHLRALAADVDVPGVHPDEVADAFEALEREGAVKGIAVIRYDDFTHVDVRGYSMRKDERSAKRAA